MAFRIFEPSHLIELKTRLALRDIIGKYTTLEHRVGPWWCGKCPFCGGPCQVFVCDQGEESFYQSKGCKARGDIIGATMILSDRIDRKHGGISFQEAVERLSELAEIPV